MATRRILASLLAVAGSVSLVAIVPGVALASGGSSSTDVPVDDVIDDVVDETIDDVVDDVVDETIDDVVDDVVDEPVDDVVDEPIDDVVDEPIDDVVDEPVDLEDTTPEVTSPGDPTSVPEPGTIFAVGALAMSAIAMKRRMQR